MHYLNKYIRFKSALTFKNTDTPTPPMDNLGTLTCRYAIWMYANIIFFGGGNVTRFSLVARFTYTKVMLCYLFFLKAEPLVSFRLQANTRHRHSLPLFRRHLPLCVRGRLAPRHGRMFESLSTEAIWDAIRTGRRAYKNKIITMYKQLVQVQNKW